LIPQKREKSTCGSAALIQSLEASVIPCIPRGEGALALYSARVYGKVYHPVTMLPATFIWLYDTSRQ